MALAWVGVFLVCFSQNDSINYKNKQRETHLLVGWFVLNGEEEQPW